MNEKQECSKRVIVAHPFQQHSLKTAVAVKKSGVLYKYVTTVYQKKHSFTKFITIFLKGGNKSRALNRKNQDLSDDDVILLGELSGLVLLFLQRVDRRKKIYTWMYLHLLRKFNRRLFYFIKHHPVDAVIVYDVVSADFVRLIRNANINIKIIMDMSAPYYNYMEGEYLKDAERNPEYSKDMIKTLESRLYSYRRDASKYEITNTDAFLVASDFTIKSLKYGGITQEIYKCEYGIDDFVDVGKVEQQNDIACEKKDIRIIYVGTVNEQKGAYQLLRVIDSLNGNHFSFDFYGNVDLTNPYIAEHKEKCTFHGHVPRQEMLNAYKEADLLVFPTLADGYGFVVPEALSKGVPVIVSCNAGASQLIHNGINGFVFDVGADEQLLQILEKIDTNPEIVYEMKKNTFNSIQALRWNRYESQVHKMLERVLK